MFLENLIKEFCVTITDKFSDLTELLVCVGYQSTALFDSLFLQIFIKSHTKIIFESFADVWQTEIQFVAYVSKSDFFHIVLLYIFNYILAIIIIDYRGIFFIDLSHSLDNDLYQITSHEFQISRFFFLVFYFKFFDQWSDRIIRIEICYVGWIVIQYFITESNTVIIYKVLKTKTVVQNFIYKFRLEKYIDDLKSFVFDSIVFVINTKIDYKVVTLFYYVFLLI